MGPDRVSNTADVVTSQKSGSRKKCVRQNVIIKHTQKLMRASGPPACLLQQVRDDSQEFYVHECQQQCLKNENIQEKFLNSCGATRSLFQGGQVANR